MKYKKIVLAGGNGYLGSVLTAYFNYTFLFPRIEYAVKDIVSLSL